MALKIYDTFKPQGDYPAVNAEDVLMPDGTRLDEMKPAYPVTDGVAELQPETYYDFGEVSTLAVTLAETDDKLAHEYCFEFVPADGFEGFSITPEPRWNAEIQIVPGKTHQVSILRGIGVMVRA